MNEYLNNEENIIKEENKEINQDSIVKNGINEEELIRQSLNKELMT